MPSARALPRSRVGSPATIAGAIVLLFANAGIAPAHGVEDRSESSRAGRIVVGAPFNVGGAPAAALWSISVSSALLDAANPPVVVGDGGLVLSGGSSGETLLAIDQRTGKTRWSRRLSATPSASSDGMVFAVVSGRRLGDGYVVAVDARTGRTRWSTPGCWVGATQHGAVVITSACVGSSSRLEARDAASGRRAWSVPWDGAMASSARLFGTTLVVQAEEDGAVLENIDEAFDVRTGRALWKRPVNTILGRTPSGDLVLDTTWTAGSQDAYVAPLTITIAAPSGANARSRTYAPDREHWNRFQTANVATVSGRSIDYAQDVGLSGDALVFRIGSTTLYRYPLAADPAVVPGTRYELGPFAPLGGGAWLVSTRYGPAFAQIGATQAILHPLRGLREVSAIGAIEQTGYIVARDRVVVFDRDDPRSFVVVRVPCRDFGHLHIAGRTLLAVCRTPTPQLIGIALPSAGTKRFALRNAARRPAEN